MIAPGRRSAAAVPSAFSLAVWLAVVLIGAKAVEMGPPPRTAADWAAYVHDLVVASHADVLFACAVGLAGQAMIVLAGRRRFVRRASRVALLLFCVASVVYAVLSIRIFTYLRAPLSYPLLYLAGDMKNMQSSVGAFVTPALVTAFVAVPALYLVLAQATQRRVPLPPGGWRRAGRALGLAALTLYVVFGWRTTLTASWINRDDRLLAENPHWALVHSSLTELFTGGMVRLKEREPYPPEAMQDFLIMTKWDGAGAKMRFPRRPRNVITLVLESTAAKYLSVYGSRYQTTPRLAAEASRSMVFDNFYCHFGLTSHSLVAILLSMYPGMTWHEYTVERPDLPGTTVAEILQSRGYRSAFIHSGDLLYSNQEGFLRNRGFDDVWDFRDLGCGPQSFSWGVEDRCLIDGMLKWIDQDRRRPFYLLGWTIQTHHPYPPSEGQRTIDFLRGDSPPDAYDLSRYLNVLHEVDRQIGRLLDGLAERGLADDTLVVITGDHGEAFGDPHDTYGHGRRLYQENVNVPLILWNPKMFAGGLRSQTIGGHVDISPTLMDILGLPVPQAWQGRSLFDPTRPPRAYFYAADNDYLLGVREQDWKYLYDVRRGREYLFDLGRDPRELVNRAAEDPERCRRLRQRVAAWMDYEERYLAAIERPR